MAKQTRRRIPGIGWVTPKPGWCWTKAGKGVRMHPLPEWGSRKFGVPSEADWQLD